MHWPRFTILQLLLLAALAALFVGLATASWRSSPWGLHPQPITPARLAEAAILTIGFVGWGVAWGAVAREHRPAPAQFRAPIELKLVWGLMFAGGLIAIAFPVALIVIRGPLHWPGIYYALAIGLVLIVAASGRRTRYLDRLPVLQMTNLLACDWVNFVLGVICHGLLRRPHVRGFLHHVNLPPASEPTAPAR